MKQNFTVIRDLHPYKPVKSYIVSESPMVIATFSFSDDFTHVYKQNLNMGSITRVQLKLGTAG
jgi:hypothetical protein